VWPTLLKRPDQVLVSKWDAASGAGFKLMLVDGGRLAFVSSDGQTEQTVRLDAPMLERRWYHVHCAVDLDARSVTLTQTPVTDYACTDDDGVSRADLSVQPGAVHGPVLIAGCPVGDDFSKPLGDVTEDRLSAALTYRASGSCPALATLSADPVRARLRTSADDAVVMPKQPWRENRIMERP